MTWLTQAKDWDSMTIDPYQLDETQFKAALAKRTTVEEVFHNASRIYGYMTELFAAECDDSVLREWTFQWWADETGEDYEVIYQEWLHPRPKKDQSAAEQAVVELKQMKKELDDEQ